MRTLAQTLGVRPGGRVVSLFDQNEATRVPALVDEIAAGATVLVVSDAGHAADQRPGLSVGGGVRRRRVDGELPARSVGGDDGAGGLRPAVRPVLLRGLRAAQALGADGLAGRAGRASSAPACSSSRRVGWRTACATPSTRSARDRRAVVCRELTKTHEEVLRGSLAELAEWAADGVLGEITVVLAGATPKSRPADPGRRGDELVDDGMRVKDACAQVVRRNPGAPSRRELYDAVLRFARRRGSRPDDRAPPCPGIPATRRRDRSRR